MRSKYLSYLRRAKTWHIVLAVVISSELLTFLLNVVQSFIRYGEISRDLLWIGAIDGLLIPLIVAPLVVSAMKYILRVEETNEQLDQEVRERRLSGERVRFLHEALDALPVGITVRGRDGKIVYVNPAEARMHGFTVDELHGRDGGSFGPSNLRKPFVMEELKAMTAWERESVNLRKNGGGVPGPPDVYTGSRSGRGTHRSDHRLRGYH